MEKLGFKILHTFFGLEPNLLKQEKLYNKKSNSIYILFSIVFIFGLYTLLYLAVEEIVYNQKWYVIALFCLIPFYSFYTLISFSYIGWRYSKSKSSKAAELFTLILRSSIQIVVFLLFSVLTTISVSDDLGSDEINIRKKGLLDSYEKLIQQKKEELLRPFENSLLETQKELDLNLIESQDSNLRVVEQQYFKNKIDILTFSRDSIKDLITKTKTQLDSKKEFFLKEIKEDLAKNNFYFIKLKNALEKDKFFIISILYLIILVLFNLIFYKRFLSKDSDYFNLDMLLQEKLIEQESIPVINHTKKYLKLMFNYNYNSPLSQDEIKDLIKKKSVFKNKENLIEKLKSVD